MAGPLMRVVTLAVLLLAALPAAARVKAFVSVLPLAGFVEAVGGPRVDVETMVRPGHSPATYEPTPKQMAAIAQAGVFFRIGVPFERSWMGRIEAVNPELKVVHLSAGMSLQPLPAHDDHGHGEAGEEALDPHVWTSPPLVIDMVRRIRDTLVALDPEQASAYARRADDYIDELRALHRQIEATLAGAEGRAFMVYHPAWGYFARTYGLEQVAIEAEGKAPGPRALAELIDRARARGVEAIFVQPQFNDTTARRIAEAMGARVITVDPLAEDYVANMQRVVSAFGEALK